MNCELCDKRATIHICEIDEGVKSEKHLCEEHGQQVEMVKYSYEVNCVQASPVSTTVSKSTMRTFRGGRNFLRKYGRMPESAEEWREGQTIPDDVPMAVIEDPEVLREFRRLDALVSFMQLRGRMPSRDELGDFP